LIEQKIAIHEDAGVWRFVISWRWRLQVCLCAIIFEKLLEDKNLFVQTDVNFFPLDYAPPTGDDPAQAVLMCGELEKLSYDGGRHWNKSLVVLRFNEFSVYEGTEVRSMTCI
jgi:hypothetical protein